MQALQRSKINSTRYNSAHNSHSCSCIKQYRSCSTPPQQQRAHMAGLRSRLEAHYAMSAQRDASVMAAATASTGQWSPHAAMAHYLAAGRHWKAVEDFYIDLVAGRACLSQLGLAPAGAAAEKVAAPPSPSQKQPTSSPELTEWQQHVEPATQSQSQEAVASSQEDQQQHRQPLQRRTFKVHVSYLGSRFSGWMRQPGKQTVEGTLAAAIAAAGLADAPAEFISSSSSSKKAKRKAARADRRAAKRAAGAAAGEQDSHASAAAAAPAVTDDLVDSSMGFPGQHQQQQQPQQAASAASQCVLPSINCGGRTDAGVTAVGQVISFYTWQQQLQPQQVVNHINTALGNALAPQQPSLQEQQAASDSTAGHSHLSDSNANGAFHAVAVATQSSDEATLTADAQLRVWHAAEVGREFHATFSAEWRRYVYLLPLRINHQQEQDADMLASSPQQQHRLLPRFTDEIMAALQPQKRQQANSTQQAQQQECVELPNTDVTPSTVNTLLQHLQGRKLNYYVYARDTPKGKDCDCTLHVARAHLVQLPPYRSEAAAAQEVQLQQQQGVSCLCIELVGDRFLRRMVRVLVATVVQQAVLLDQTSTSSNQQSKPALHAAASPQAAAEEEAGADNCEVTTEPLVALMSSMDRQVTAPPAPALGLCFAAVGYDDDDC